MRHSTLPWTLALLLACALPIGALAAGTVPAAGLCSPSVPVPQEPAENDSETEALSAEDAAIETLETELFREDVALSCDVCSPCVDSSECDGAVCVDDTAGILCGSPGKFCICL